MSALLPPNATAIERTLASSLARLSGVPTPIEEVWRPTTCPAALLPWLAWALSVDVWDDRWSVEKQRQVVARSLALHRLKGTAEGLRRHVALTGGALTQLVVPPQGLYASRTLTKAEMDAWLRTMPQIRVYLAREFGSAAGLAFASAPVGPGYAPGFHGHAFARFDAGRALFGRAARLWDRGIETRLRIIELTTIRESRRALRIERVTLPGKAGAALFAARSFAGRAYADAVAVRARLVTWRQDVTYEHRLSSLSLRAAVTAEDLGGDLEPVDVRAERIAGPGHAGASVFARRFIVGGLFYGRDNAPWLMYDRIVLHDRRRAAPKVEAVAFAGRARLGVPRYTARAVVDLRYRMQRSALVAGAFLAARYALPEDKSRQASVRLAARAAKSARDRIGTTHKLTRPRTLADGIPLDGTFRFGARVPFRL